MKSKASQRSRFLRIITVPVRALSRARDLYVRSLTDYADKMNYGNAMPIPVTSQVTALPKSFSVSSARSHEFEDLVRASSTRSMGDRVDLDSYIKLQQMKMRAAPAPRAMPPRSTSVAMGRIDEDSPCCYFGEDCDIKFPRSRSHALSATRLWSPIWFFFPSIWISIGKCLHINQSYVWSQKFHVGRIFVIYGCALMCLSSNMRTFWHVKMDMLRLILREETSASSFVLYSINCDGKKKYFFCLLMINNLFVYIN